ncbi:hypothetical protein LTR56_019207 [Elasticomyces elasticus]|nr:hypothetical protein LTR56_019207 [Elasticomyces elasticus]KAK3633215.1 hypothetical protein LTR22_020215 [Elasticomyces elasticus]KAK4910626.1 hypothetical protein LTR49_020758 [Elasticomyces elasticus]KAK5751037.1 hypothetical protein LTS12_018938 [Elasticomyces elasticus]
MASSCNHQVKPGAHSTRPPGATRDRHPHPLDARDAALPPGLEAVVSKLMGVPLDACHFETAECLQAAAIGPSLSVGGSEAGMSRSSQARHLQNLRSPLTLPPIAVRKATIDGSPSIRKALFLEPGTADDLAHDAQILKADPDFFHSGAQNGVSHYAVHPLFVSGWPSINSIPVEHLQKQATRLPGVFLTQPSRLTRGTRLWVCEPTSDWIDWQLKSKGAFVELQCDETFDDLGSKLEEVMRAHKMNPAFVEYHWSGAWRSGRVL